MRIGDRVRMRAGADVQSLLGHAAPLIGVVGDLWTDERGERISVVYESAQVFVQGMAALAFEPAHEPPTEAEHRA